MFFDNTAQTAPKALAAVFALTVSAVLYAAAIIPASPTLFV